MGNTENIYNIIIVDDEKDARELLKLLISQHPLFKVISTASNAEEAIISIEKYRPDLIFLDIEMPGKDGFQITQEIHERGMETDIIFVTAHNHYAINAIRNSAFDFILKPVVEEELIDSLNRFVKEDRKTKYSQRIQDLISQIKQQGKIRFNIKNGFILIDPDDIIYLQANGNTSFIHLIDGQTEEVNFTLGKTIERIPSGNFLRIGRSFIINTNYLIKVDRKKRACFLMSKTEEIQLELSQKAVKELEELGES